jgi:MarR family 2-MHQ and catechol resistance regulon transcriptional repressor
MVIDNLERGGLVRRERSVTDRRYIRVHLTEQGHAMIHDVFPTHVHEITKAMNVLTPAEQEQLGSLCRKLGKKSLAE